MVQRTEKELKQQIEEGRIKEASARITIPAGGTENFVISTPPSNGADVKASILSYIVSATATVNLDFYDGVTIDTAGTDMLINNSKTGAGDTTDITFEYGGTYSGGTKNGEDLIPAGVKAKATGARTTDIRRIVSNGDTVRYEFTNTDGSSSQDVAVKIIFFEKPVE